MTSTDHRATSRTSPILDRLGAALLVVGGVAWVASGPMHPQGSDEGDKTAQLHSMLVDDLWYPAHAVGLLGFACLAAGLVALYRQAGWPAPVRRTLRVATIVSVVATAGALVALLAGTQADGIADGEMTPLAGLFMGVETLVNPVWGLAMAALAVVGGLTGALGNRVLAVAGTVGGVAFAVASATIAFVDTFDPLFPVSSLLGVWAVVVAALGLLRRP